ncbi:MAG: hypothetical protein QF570_18435 [Myxococcota bacterium]|jgi:hypothetical protein|nr:hypothetical protein [Myxococcota bacterium]
MSSVSGFEFYAGFEWAVPVAFAAAVHACRFEQGDVLYSETSAYSGSKRAKRPARHHIQVLDPPRTTRALASEGEGQRFFSNWASPVRFEWRDYRRDETRECTTTQGQLFTCLWKGDVDLLSSSSPSASDRPLLLRDLQPRIERAAEILAGEFAGESRGKKAERPRHLFVVGLDLSSDASLSKAQAIESTLRSGAALRVETRTPVELGLDEADRFHPALAVRGYASALDKAEDVEQALRQVLYAGAKSTEDSEGGGRFQLNRHGCLRPL